MPEPIPFTHDAESYLAVMEAAKGKRVILDWRNDINTPSTQARKTLKGSGEIRVLHSSCPGRNYWIVSTSYPVRCLMRGFNRREYDTAEDAKHAVDQYLATLPSVWAVGVVQKEEK